MRAMNDGMSMPVGQGRDTGRVVAVVAALGLHEGLRGRQRRLGGGDVACDRLVGSAPRHGHLLAESGGTAVARSENRARILTKW